MMAKVRRCSISSFRPMGVREPPRVRAPYSWAANVALGRMRSSGWAVVPSFDTNLPPPMLRVPFATSALLTLLSAAAQSPVEIALEVFHTGFTNPVDIVNCGDDRLFIVTQ